MDIDHVGECFLAETSGLAVGAEIPPHNLLQVTLGHVSKRRHVLLDGLQTYK